MGKIMFFLLAGLALTGCSSVESAREPTLVMIGGALRYDNKEIFSRMIRLSGSSRARIAVFPTASGNPLKYGNYAVEAFRRYGADPVLIPLAVKKIDQDYREIVRDPEWLETVRQCSGIYFTGGAQERITEVLFEDDGSNTPMLDVILEVHKSGGMIAGTSAGAAMMSRIMIRDAQDVFNILANGAEMGREIDRGLGLVPDSLFIDQHFLTRGRFARTLIVMNQEGFKYGIGIDENTAVIMTPNGECEVLGTSGAVLLDFSEAVSGNLEEKAIVSDVRISYLEHGDIFNPFEGVISVSEHKKKGILIDPGDPEFKPYYRRNFFYNDILANSVLKDLLKQFIDNGQETVKALAFKTGDNGLTDKRGYEFTFRKKEDSVGYYSGKAGGENYSVLNIYLDLKAVRMKEKIYE